MNQWNFLPALTAKTIDFGYHQFTSANKKPATSTLETSYTLE